MENAHCNACHEDHHGIESFADHGPLPPHDVDQHLKFDHKAHLDPGLPEKLRLAGFDAPLACADCHRLEGDGFRPIAFEEHCASCHREMLDPGAADVAVPHGLQFDALRTWVLGFYGRHGRDGTPAAEPRPEADARADTDAAMAALAGKERASCALCHEIDASRDPPRIVPPAVPDRWRRPAAFDATKATPLARFDHRAHRFPMEGAPPGPEGNCLACHAGVADSTSAADRNLPRTESCRQCHTPGGAGTSCVSCHPFHAAAR